MIPVLCAILPLVVAQQPTFLYNGGTPGTANCAVKTSACDCHYASCTLSGVCACGWDDSSKTCKAGVTTKCASCPAMNHCSVNEKLKIGPNGFPVPGQLSVWGNVPYPDHSGKMPETPDVPDNVMVMPATSPDIMSQTVVSQPPRMPRMPPQTVTVTVQQQPTQTLTTAQLFGQPQIASTTAQDQTQVSDQTQIAQDQSQPTFLYQNNPLSAGGCALKKDACDCHYASCTATGDCVCGWDTTTKTCRAGIQTKCESCPAMHRCGTNQPLLIGPDGFPVPGQLSVWGQVPYPDQSGKGKKAAAPTAATTTATTTTTTTTTGKAGKAGKAKGGKTGKNNQNKMNTTQTGMQ